ncbi:MAG TPA: LacI family DNA-binding transcriptional regulator [Terriglobia bacterium]|nr:LacI family DNA-binding transcriptional regulator [Terriglobia bacterium]
MGPTIRDVAREAKVSTATVSHVLNNTGQPSPRTRLHVLAVVRRLGYFPNAHARNLASRNSRTLGIIVSDIENPFFPEVIRSFEARARQLGYEVILGDTNYDPNLMRRATERMLEHHVRGVAVMTSEANLQLIQEIARRRIAVTFLDLGPVQEYVSNLRIDYFSGIEQVVEHLFQLGHRRMIFAGERPGLKSNIARREAFIACMKARGLDPGPNLKGDLRFAGGVAAGLATLTLKPRPTAVVAVNDLTAVGLIKGFTQAGLRVPEDISVTGFDKIQLAEYVTPSITTVDIHRDWLGRTAADALHELSSADKPQGREYPIPAELIVRASTGPARSRESKVEGRKLEELLLTF